MSLEFYKGTKYAFMGKRKKAYTFSAVIILVGMLSLVVSRYRTGEFLRYGVDFTGGSLIQVSFDKHVSDDEVRTFVQQTGITGAEITRSGGQDVFYIRAQNGRAGSVSKPDDVIRTALKTQYGQVARVDHVDFVTPTIGDELAKGALYVIIAASVLTLLYVAFRFEFRFGVAAIGSSLHDVMITFAILSIFRIEIKLDTVAAVLTVLGYSMNDTVVVFDRVREHLKAGMRGPMVEILDRSINETLPRTVLTATTVLLAALSLYLLGGSVLRDFCFVLILGISIGTFSSIFVASPFLLELDNRKKKVQSASQRAVTVAAN